MKLDTTLKLVQKPKSPEKINLKLDDAIFYMCNLNACLKPCIFISNGEDINLYCNQTGEDIDMIEFSFVECFPQ